jgi:heptosyltransferase-2
MDELDAGFAYPPRPVDFTRKYSADSILVKEVNWLGDLVMSLPALRTVRRAYPLARVSILVKASLTGFFDGFDWINEVIPYPDTAKNLTQKFNIVRNLRSRHFDLAVLFPNSFESALWVMLGGIPRRAGFATDARGFMLTDSAIPEPRVLSGHQSGYWLSMVQATLGINVEQSAWDKLEVSKRHLNKMHEWLLQHRLRKGSPLIAIAPVAAYGPAKEWPASSYASLIDQLANSFDAECIIVGASAEAPRCQELAAACRSRPLIAAGEINLGELIALLSLCDGFAGNDSGAMHLAGSLAIPTAGIFGSTNPNRTHALGPKVRSLINRLPCNPCLARTCRFGHYNCLKAISPAEVVSALLQLGALG